MQIKYFDRKDFWTPDSKFPAPEGWSRMGDGGLVGDHFRSVTHVTKAKDVHATTVDSINESYFEQCALASMLQEIVSPTLIFMELGAGWGGQSLSVTQMVRNGLAPAVHDTWCFGIEAEPGHFGFLGEAFFQNRINGMLLFGAMTEHVGWEKFYSQTPPADNYGQSLRGSGNLRVPCYTVDYLVDTFNMRHVDVVHMDVQGEEPNTLRGALDTMSAGAIDYMLVCPHFGTQKAEIEEIVAPWFDVIVSIDARAGYLEIPGFPKPVYHPQDGIVVCKRKGL